MSNPARVESEQGVSLRYLTIPFFLVHLVALIGPFLVGIRWEWVLLAVGSYYLRMFAITAGYHRYFAHRSFRTSRWFQFLLAVLGATATQKGVLWWSGHHRHHHRYSDTDQDVHSPKKGVWWSHVGWILSDAYSGTDHEVIKDFSRYPELRWLNRWHLVPVVAYATLFWLVGGWGALVWGFFVSTTLLWHGTFLVNSAAHIFGKVRFESGDTSKNSWIIALLTMGEGWHNNHHYYQPSVRQGFYWWEIDVSYYLLKGLAALGVVWDLRMPPQRILDEGRVADGRVREPLPSLPRVPVTSSSRSVSS
jgi:stearoyl-CoA desaturase (delta-9 desaturase)